MSVRFGIRAGLLRAVPSMHGVQIKINSAIQDKNPTQITIEKCCLRHWDSSLSGRGLGLVMKTTLENGEMEENKKKGSSKDLFLPVSAGILLATNRDRSCHDPD